MEMVLWNAILSLFVGLVLWFAKVIWGELQRVQILVNRTREEVAKEYVTKAEVHSDINRVLDRLDRLEAKLDAFIRDQKSAIN